MLYISEAVKNKYRNKYNAYDESVPNTVLIQSYDPINDSVKLDTNKGDQIMTCYHPAVYSSSWIRCTPEIGTAVTMRTNADQSIVIGTNSPGRDNRITAYANNLDLYRPLRGGEIEMHSAGIAQLYMSKNPVLELSAGIVKSWHDQIQLEYGVKAPLIRQVLSDTVFASIQDEVRFGYVARYTDNTQIKNNFIKLADQTTFAKEYTRVFTNDLQFLEDYRVGNVVDDDGTILVSTDNVALRVRHRYYTTSTDYVQLQIDENGTTLIEFPTTTKYVNLINKGDDITIKTKKNITIETQEENLRCNIKKNVQIQCKELRVGSADDFAVLANVLKNMLNEVMQMLMTHTHVGNLGAPTPLQSTDVTRINTIINSYLNNNAFISDYIKISKTAGNS